MQTRAWPNSTYRVQLRAELGFDRAAQLVPYLARLGISHLYCSPYLQAAPGSSHGYDVVDHSRLSRDLGGDAGHAALARALSDHDMGQLLDIVPNHMAVAGRANPWWWDVLENGPASMYAERFDIDWWGPDEKSGPTVLVPILGDHYGRILEAGEVRIEREGGTFLVRYHEHELPLSPRTLGALLTPAAQQSGSAELAELARISDELPDARRAQRGVAKQRHQQKEQVRERLRALSTSSPETARILDDEARALSSDPDRLDQLLRRQCYRLAYWRTASEELDYRRFFNIESLVGLRVEDEETFSDSHRLVLKLVRDGIVHGLRIDHIDGLRNPLDYLERLRAESGDTYIVVEKILERDERLPSDWPIQGTSGYDFVGRINNLFVERENERAMTDCYARFTDERASYADVVHEAKRQVMAQDLRAEVDGLTRLLGEVCDEHRRHRDHTPRALRETLVQFLAAFPVYRTYVQPGRPLRDEDREHVRHAVDEAARRRPELDRELLDFLGQLALLEHPGRAETELALRLAQVSAPVMAKGGEDTAFYRYNRLISLNEVGGDPGTFGRPLAKFHEDMRQNAERFPWSMLTLSTHDTKRSADVRARIHLLSEMPEAWGRAVAGFAEHNARHLRDHFPDPNMEYALYQTLVGAWPIEADRVLSFMDKSTREAKVHTSWIDPNAEYDAAVRAFVHAVLADEVFTAKLETFLREQRLVTLGRINSLSQTTLLLTCPGVADVYQGDELWNLSLVDPDNRREVDFAERAALLGRLERSGGPALSVADDDAGLHKLWLVSRLLRHRRAHPSAFVSTRYEPLPTSGDKARHAVAFARDDLVVLVPRLLATLADDWGDTHVTLPPGRYRNLLGDAQTDGGVTPVGRLLEAFPVCVLQREED